MICAACGRTIYVTRHGLCLSCCKTAPEPQNAPVHKPARKVALTASQRVKRGLCRRCGVVVQLRRDGREYVHKVGLDRAAGFCW